MAAQALYQFIQVDATPQNAAQKCVQSRLFLIWDGAVVEMSIEVSV